MTVGIKDAKQMQKKGGNNLSSPYFQPEDSLALFRLRILQHIELLKIPAQTPANVHPCSRECHILERNHTLEALEDFIHKLYVL